MTLPRSNGNMVVLGGDCDAHEDDDNYDNDDGEFFSIYCSRHFFYTLLSL